MNETSKTYGSVESTDEEKKRLAQESLKFNIENPVFVELFPELTKEIKDKLDKQAKERPAKRKEETAAAASNRSPSIDRNKILQSVFLNLMLVVAFIVVIFLLKYAISLTA